MDLGLERVNADLLILGSGAAACMAAIRAHEAGVNALMVTKGALGMGNTPLAPGGFESAIGHADPKDSPQIHFEDTLKAGMGLSHQKVVWAIAQEMIRIPFDLEQWGCPLPKKGDKFIQRSTQLLSYPRLLEIGDKTGRTLIDTFRKQVTGRKIACLAHVMATNLLIADSGVVGALALDLNDLKLLVINSRVTLLASGGMGQVFAVTDNSPLATGDGYALAYRAGAELRDMEMVEFQLTRYLEGLKPGPTKSSSLIFAGGRLYNARGERFMKKYYPQTLEQSSRAEINKAVGLEIRAGRGTPEGCVYLDASSLSEEFMKEKIISVFNLHASRGIDLTWQPMRLCSTVHTFMGGVGIDEKGRTALPGLYAAGEVSGGFNGASRLGGNALTNALGMGSIAGREAAAECRHRDRKAANEEQVSGELGRLKEIAGRSTGTEEAKARDELRRAMWKNVGVTREGGELASNLESLAKIKAEIPRLWPAGTKPAAGLRKVLELENMLLMGEMITRAALLREESRGAHTRIDHPDIKPEWLKNIIVRAAGEEMQLFTRPVVELTRKS